MVADDNESTTPSYRHSPLNAAHVALGAKMVPFGGWEMPLAYPSGTMAEHRACREGAVAFDVSHLGAVRVQGPTAFDDLQHSLSNDLRRIAPGRAQYTHLLDETGSVADDIIVLWIDDELFDVMPNASNTSRVVAAIGGEDVTSEPGGRRRAGPERPGAPGGGFTRCGRRPAFRRRPLRLGGDLVRGLRHRATPVRTGSSVRCRRRTPSEFWSAILDTGVLPAGLGARDTLRLEAGLPLHGHELGPGITPLQAELGWVVGWSKGDFIGRAALEEERDEGPRRRLRGVVGEGRQPLRDGAEVFAGGRDVGFLTSGNFSPMRERGIGLALIDAGRAAARR